MITRIRRWYEESLENRIALSSTALVLFTVALFGTISYRTSQQMIEARIAADVSLQSDLIAKAVQKSLEDRLREAAAIAANSITANGLVDSAGRDTYLLPFLREHPLAAQSGFAVALCDFQGALIAATSVASCSRLAQYRDVITSAEPRAEIGGLPGPASLVLGFPVRYPGTGQIEGAVVAAGAIDSIVREARSRVPIEFAASLADGTGRTILGPAPGPQARFHALRLPKPLDETGLRLYLEPDLGAQFAPLRRLALVYVLLGLGLTLGVNALSRVVSRRIAKPVRTLVSAARQIGGDVRAQVRLPEGERGEFAELAGAFADMQARLMGSYDELEARVRERTARLDAIFSLSPDGFVSFDAAGRVAYVNPSFLRMTGLESARIVGLDLGGFDGLLARYCDPAQNLRTTAELAAGSGADRSDRLFRDVLHFVVPARRTISRAMRIGPSGWPELVLYFRDVTREAEVDRMKSEFLSTAAHELRTPMASILGFSELLLNRQFDEPRRRDMIQTIHGQSQLLTKLLNELLDLARIEARRGKDFQMERRPLAPIVAGVIGNLYVAGDPRQVEVAIPAGLPDVHVDPTKLQQALTNVIANAYKYSPCGGPISLVASEELRGDRNGVCVVVTDQGIGMTPGDAARAFERFFRADASGSVPGTGLGLALVKEIVELHQGEIALDSEAGKGTRVILWLPCADSQPASLLQP